MSFICAPLGTIPANNFEILQTNEFVELKLRFVGVHIADVPKDTDPIPGNQWRFICQLLYNPILGLVKTSVLLFLLRLGGQKRGMRISIHVLNALNLGQLAAQFIVVIFQCRPVAGFWDRSLHPKCINTTEFVVSTSSLTIFTDILVLMLPIWMLWNLQIRFKAKMGISAVLMLGVV